MLVKKEKCRRTVVHFLKFDRLKFITFSFRRGERERYRKKRTTKKKYIRFLAACYNSTGLISEDRGGDYSSPSPPLPQSLKRYQKEKERNQLLLFEYVRVTDACLPPVATDSSVSKVYNFMAPLDLADQITFRYASPLVFFSLLLDHMLIA